MRVLDENEDYLVSGLKKKNPDAFRQLVEEYKHNVLNVCYRFVNNREVAEDLAQDVFVEVYQSINSFRQQSSLKTWIHHIHIINSLYHLRKTKRQ